MTSACLKWMCEYVKAMMTIIMWKHTNTDTNNGVTNRWNTSPRHSSIADWRMVLWSTSKRLLQCNSPVSMAIPSMHTICYVFGKYFFFDIHTQVFSYRTISFFYSLCSIATIESDNITHSTLYSKQKHLLFIHFVFVVETITSWLTNIILKVFIFQFVLHFS